MAPSAVLCTSQGMHPPSRSADPKQKGFTKFDSRPLKKYPLILGNVSKEAVRFLNHYLEYHAITGRRDFLGLKQLLEKDPKFGEYLATAPTRGAQYFPTYSKTVGSAWQS